MMQDAQSTSKVATFIRPLQCSSIARLPLEILVLIFKIIHSATADPFLIVYDRWRLPYKLQAVCIFWMNAVRQTPSLWSVVNFSSREAHNLSISRAKSYPLHLHLNSIHIVRYLSPILQRPMSRTEPTIASEWITKTIIGSLSVSLSDNIPPHRINTNLPNLRKLIIDSNARPFVQLRTPLSPSLEEVRLTNVFFRSLLSPSNIRVLSIATNRYPYEVRLDPQVKGLTIKSIVGVLSNCPKLEHLSLINIDNMFATHGAGHLNPSRISIPLKHLKRLHLRMKPVFTSPLLSHLIIPTETRISLSARLNPSQIDFQVMFPPLFPNRSQGLMVIPELYSVILVTLGYGAFRILYSRKACTPGDGVLGVHCLTAKFNWPFSNRAVDMGEVAYATILRLPFPTPAAQVKDIHLILRRLHTKYITSAQWKTIFSRFVGVTSLCLTMDMDYDDQVGYNWLDALESESLSGDGLTLPNLGELRLAGISVDVKFSGHLKSVLDRRALQLGKPLSMLSITPQRLGIPWPELALNLGGVKHFFYHSDGVHRAPMCTCTLVCRAHE